MAEYTMVAVNIGEYLKGLEGDVWVNDVTVMHTKEKEYTVVDWGHDGINCYDIWETENGYKDIYHQMGEDEYEDHDFLFESVYLGTVASLRLQMTEEGISRDIKDYVIQNIIGKQ